MSLRTKLLLGYVGFVLALGVLGTWSARTLREMSAVSGRIISENYDSVVAAQNMKESLERQDSGALFDLLGQRQRASGQIDEHRTRLTPRWRPRRRTSPKSANGRSSSPSVRAATSTTAGSTCS